MAVSIENPADTLKKGNFSVGIEADISGRDIKYSNQEINENLLQYLVKGSYGVMDWLNIFGTVGAARIHDDTGFEGELGLAYGGGVKVRFYQYQDVFILGLTGQFLRFTSEEDNVAGVSGLNYKSTWNEYDIGLGASTKIGASNFYAGGLFSMVDGELETPATTAHFKESHPLGIFVGGDSELIDNFRLGVEGRLVNEVSVAFKLTYVFDRSKPDSEKK